MINVKKQIADLVQPVLEEMGLELVAVEYASTNRRWVLRLFIDKEGGVTIEDCVSASRELGDLIEVKDIIKHEYVLEVSSPGLNIPLVKETDYIKAIGRKIKVKMIKSIHGQKNFSGYLKDFKQKILSVETEKGIIELVWENVDKANLIYEF